MTRTAKALAALLAALPCIALADTTDVKSAIDRRVKKQGAHCKDDPNCFNRYHPAIKPVRAPSPDN